MDSIRIEPTTRRRFLRQAAGLLGGLGFLGSPSWRGLFGAEGGGRKSSARIAAIVTEYRPLSHADVILSRLLADYTLEGEPFYSPVRLHSMYVEQFPERDMARWVSKAYGVRLAETIEAAILDEGGKLAVDGVWIIGEHGNYPQNERGQTLYPRRRFFEGVAAAFKKAGAVAPVFNDKHLSARWEDALWMVETARSMNIPFMAGSSLPLAWRRPRLELPLDSPLEEALAVGYGGIESYGFHALETLQCMAERRSGGEAGVAAIQCLEGAAVWEAGKQGRWSRRLLEAALERQIRRGPGDPEKQAQDPAAFLIEHRDGFRAAVLILNGAASEFSFAAKLPGQERPVSTLFWLQEPGYGHFAYLARALSEMVLSGKPVYPVERTLLTSGLLCRALDSRFEGHRRIETPELAVAYRAVDHGLGAYSRPDDYERRSGGWIEFFGGPASLNWPGNWREHLWEGEPKWEASEGLLRSAGGKGYLATFEEFADFELFAELRVWDAAGGRGNSGIYLRCQPHRDPKAEYPPGYEVQVDHGDANNPTGSIYNMGARAAKVITRDREWFTLRVLAQGPRLRTWVNGEPMADWTDPQARYQKGYLLLQQHHATGVTEWRELRVRRV
ncbi:MAG: DUF1080 domain-containing protein [Planctomycetes bacterium]|nr:DUF1080 domain-containing protein [Planctomycetota bacterium]